MKKHAGKVVCTGILVSVFGLIVMAGTMIVADRVLGAGYKSANELLQESIITIGDASWILLFVGLIVLAMGFFMHTQSE
ncbi:MAG: hypothetical protein ABH983_01860 [Candidatus Micrarchaeota archaeon]|nr:hypothetical protein [Candidatus Micrarchaeota archaeon]